MTTHTTSRLRAEADSPWYGGFGVGRAIWMITMVVVAILLLGIALTWANANGNNELVHAVMRAGRWLATPFHDVFNNTNARERLTENWLLAAGIYLVAGRVLAWIL